MLSLDEGFITGNPLPVLAIEDRSVSDDLIALRLVVLQGSTVLQVGIV